MIDPAGEMGFLDHLEELRWRIIKGLLAIIVGSAVSFGFIDQILEILLKPTTATSYRIALQVLSVQGMFLIKWFIAFISGFVLAMPVVVYQIWRFVTPGLKINEKRYALPVVLFACISFITGVSFGYLVLIPFSLEFFSGMGAGLVENNFSITYYFSFLTWLLLGAGIILIFICDRCIDSALYAPLSASRHCDYFNSFFLYYPSRPGIHADDGCAIGGAL